MNTSYSLIPVYVINLKARTDRKDHVVREFSQRPEFFVNYVEAIEHPIGAVGLWQSMKLAIRDAMLSNHEYVIICEDDHVFTDSYNCQMLESQIDYCFFHDAELLHGGVSFFDLAVQISPRLFWTNQFRATQFFVVFRSMYQKILDVAFHEADSADGKLSALSDTTLLIYPFISKQKEFGYSDILTSEFQRHGSVTTLFDNTERKLAELRSVSDFYELNR